MDNENLWINNPKILYEEYWKIIPNETMNQNEKINATTRLAIYFSFIAILLFSNIYYSLILTTLIIVIIIMIFNIQKNKKTENNTNILTAINDVYDNVHNDDKNIIKSGYIDGDGNYRVGERDEIIKTNDDEKCRTPTVENPFMNIVFSDYMNMDNLPRPCNVSDDKLDKEVNMYYDSSLFRTVQDVYNRNNSQRLMYSVPVNTDVESVQMFREWLYKVPTTCKENTKFCKYYNEPRFYSNYF